MGGNKHLFLFFCLILDDSNVLVRFGTTDRKDGMERRDYNDKEVSGEWQRLMLLHDFARTVSGHKGRRENHILVKTFHKIM